MIEIIVAIGIMSIILSSLFSSLNFGNRTFFGGVSRREIQSQTRDIVEVLKDEIRYAPSGVMLVQDTSEDGTYIKISENGIQKFEVSSEIKSYSYMLEDESVDFSESIMTKEQDSVRVVLVSKSRKQRYEAEAVVRPFNGGVEGDKGKALKIMD